MNPLPTILSTGSKSLQAQRISCAQVAMDVPLAKLFDYAVPHELEVRIGDRVTVPFGARQRVGVVVATNEASEVPAERLKSISTVRDDAPRLTADWLELLRFLATYYQRPLGETVIGALPPRLRSTKALPKKVLREVAGASSPRFVESHPPTPAQQRVQERMAAAFGSFRAFL